MSSININREMSFGTIQEVKVGPNKESHPSPRTDDRQIVKQQLKMFKHLCQNNGTDLTPSS